MSDTQELERRLQETLRAKAAQVDVTEERFNAMSQLVEVARSSKRSRRSFIAVATALAVAAAATGVVLVARPKSRGPLVATQSSATTPTTSAERNGPNPAAPLLAPSWVPDGQKLWSLTSNTQPAFAQSSQLFGTVATDGALAPGLLVEIQPSTPGAGVGDGTAVTVRGHNGVTRASKDAGDAPFEIDWIEDDGFVRHRARCDCRGGCKRPRRVADTAAV